jgi:hypothetical protein
MIVAILCAIITVALAGLALYMYVRNWIHAADEKLRLREKVARQREQRRANAAASAAAAAATRRSESPLLGGLGAGTGPAPTSVATDPGRSRRIGVTFGDDDDPFAGVVPGARSASAPSRHVGEAPPVTLQDMQGAEDELEAILGYPFALPDGAGGLGFVDASPLASEAGAESSATPGSAAGLNFGPPHPQQQQQQQAPPARRLPSASTTTRVKAIIDFDKDL